MEQGEVTLHSSVVPAMSMPTAGMLPTLDPVTILSSREPLAVRPATVHVWCFALSGTAETVELCRDLLSQEECHRADPDLGAVLFQAGEEGAHGRQTPRSR